MFYKMRLMSLPRSSGGGNIYIVDSESVTVILKEVVSVIVIFN